MYFSQLLPFAILKSKNDQCIAECLIFSQQDMNYETQCTVHRHYTSALLLQKVAGLLRSLNDLLLASTDCEYYIISLYACCFVLRVCFYCSLWMPRACMIIVLGAKFTSDRVRANLDLHSASLKNNLLHVQSAAKTMHYSFE